MLPTKYKVYKYTLYALLAYLFAVLQATPGLFVLWGVRPVLTAALAVSVAVLEGGFAGGLFAACAGLLVDSFSYNRFGFNGVFYLFCCVLAGLLIESYMRPVLLNCVLFSFGTVFLMESVVFAFRFLLPRYPDAFLLYLFSIIPMSFYTAAMAVPVFWLTRGIHQEFKKRVVA